MRVGFNPNKDKNLEKSEYIHQIVIPVYIPNDQGYFKDSLRIFKLCLESLFKTVHDRTFITIVNNGSSQDVKEFLDGLYHLNRIHEIIHTENIGKLNAILKGVVGNDIELVTISDADVLFLSSWQEETIKVFNKLPKAGVVGIVPQFKMYESYCGNVIFENFLSKKLRFYPVKNPSALKEFYKSVGWKNDYNKDYLKYILGLEVDDQLSVLIGTGHFVATYKKDIFEEVSSYINFKLGGVSEKYLDKAPLKKDYWRLTTEENYALHMGNTFENWMKIDSKRKYDRDICVLNYEIKRKAIGKFVYFIKNRLFIKFISVPFLNKLFLKYKKLPKEMIRQY